LTTQTEAYISNEVKNSIYSYAQDELYSFQSTFVLSQLQNYIENAEPSITASDISLYLQNRVLLTPGTTQSYTINFNTPIRKGDQFQRIYTYPEITVPDSTGTSRKIYFEEVPEAYTGIGFIGVVNAGYGYSSTPVITISGDGSGATAEALVVGGRIRSVNITNPGINYTVATVSISDGSGVEALLSINLSSNFGKLRTYYFEPNGQKVYVNNNAGTIDYLNGIITLSSLTLLSVSPNPFYDENILTVNVVPGLSVIPPLRNRLLAIDTNNARTVQINMVPKT
jgi:hypothetical protein